MIVWEFLQRFASIHPQPPPRAVGSPPMAARVEIFQGEPRADGRPALWYFRHVARNGRVADGSQGYARKDSAKRGALRRWPDLPVIEVEGAS